MNKPTMYKFLHAYMHNLYEVLVDNEYAISELTFERKIREAKLSLSDLDVLRLILSIDK